jgi:hypothetical protein
MLTREELTRLYRESRNDKVLSVYLEGGAHDFAERGVWRKRLDRALTDLEKSIEAGGTDDIGAFRSAADRIQEELAGVEQFLPGKGWVGFATGDRLVHAEALPVPMPDLARWEAGLRIAPYVRALKQERLVVVVLVDSRKARVFEYREGELKEVKDLIGDAVLEDFASINVSKRATGYTGVRGKTGTDAAQWSHDNETERLLKRVGQVVTERVGPEGFVVVGGVPEAIAATVHHFPPALRARTAERPSATVTLSEAEVRDLASEAASALHRSMQANLLDEVIGQARSRGKGALGGRNVEAALEEGRVDTLLLSRTFIAGNPDYADRLVGVAFEGGADVEELSVEGAARLDVEGKGVAARLRYVLGE